MTRYVEIALQKNMNVKDFLLSCAEVFGLGDNIEEESDFYKKELNLFYT
jgi:hypothetical protein